MKRRSLLQSRALALFGSAAGANGSKFGVTGFELFRIKVNRPRQLDDNAVQGRVPGLQVPGICHRAATTGAAVRFLQQFFNLLKTRSIYDIEWFRGAVQPEIARGGAPAAVATSAIEQRRLVSLVPPKWLPLPPPLISPGRIGYFDHLFGRRRSL